MEQLKVDNSILSSHPKLGSFVSGLRSIAGIIDQERKVDAARNERCVWVGADNYATYQIKAKGLCALYGDDVLKTLDPARGKKVDIILGVIKNVATKQILAIECKFKVGPSTCARKDFYEEIEDKHTHVWNVIGEQPIPFYEKWVILMCRWNAAICKSNIRRFRNENKGLATFSNVECVNVEELEQSLNA